MIHRRGVVAVIRREYRGRVWTPWFLVATLGLPLLLLLVALASSHLGSRMGHDGGVLTVVDRTEELYSRVAPRLEEVGFRVREGDPGASEAQPSLLPDAGGDGAALILDSETVSRGRIVYLGRQPPSPLRRVAIRQVISEAALELRLQAEGGGAELLRGGELEVRLVGSEEASLEAPAGGVVLGVGGALILYFVFLVYGSVILRSVMEEKVGKVVELILPALRPWELMLGKILGVGAVGLTQLAAWTALGGGGVWFATRGAFGGGVGLPGLGELEAFIPTPALLAYFVVVFALGYLLYAALFAVVGAVCSKEEEAQQAQLPVILLVILPLILLLPVLDAPAGQTSRLLSFVPFFTPVLMFVRVALGAAASWEVALSSVLLTVAVVAVTWVAGRSYRTGILMQGKRPSLPELWRWIRA